MPREIGPHLLGRKPSPPDPRDYRMAELLPASQRVDPVAASRQTSYLGRSPARPTFWQRVWSVLRELFTGKLPPPNPDPPGPPPPPPPPDDYVRLSTIQLDQGNTPHCVGFGTAHWLAADPVQDAVTDADGHAIYYECKVIDGEPGAEDGSWVRSAATAMVARSRMGAYYFASGVQEIESWLRLYGPVIMGTDWWSAMFSPDGEGFVRPQGQVAGGHCWVVLGQLRDGSFLCQNSWGEGWGIGGRFRIRRTDLALLLAADGEACGAAELP